MTVVPTIKHQKNQIYWDNFFYPFTRWKQLAMVTLFYFIFVFIFALIGVHSIGVMDYACVYKTLEEDGNYRCVL